MILIINISGSDMCNVNIFLNFITVNDAKQKESRECCMSASG